MKKRYVDSNVTLTGNLLHNRNYGIKDSKINNEHRFKNMKSRKEE